MLGIIRAQLECQGFYKIPQFFSEAEVKALLKQAKHGIDECIEQIGCPGDLYLKGVSRWLFPSPPLHNCKNLIYERISPLITEILSEEAKLTKLNLICKSSYAKEAIPFHQDISYSPDSPYKVSAWLPLQSITHLSGGISFLPKSHKLRIEPARDFWSPFYKDISGRPPLNCYPKIYIEAQAGDLVLFDSCIWHGSPMNKNGCERLAIVSRWTTPSFKPPMVIPPKQTLYFGMWNCGALTQSILSEGMAVYRDKKFEDKLSLFTGWERLLADECPAFIDAPKLALEALTKVRILDQASQLHNGGDALGVVYKELWYSLVKETKQWLEANSSENC